MAKKIVELSSKRKVELKELSIDDMDLCSDLIKLETSDSGRTIVNGLNKARTAWLRRGIAGGDFKKYKTESNGFPSDSVLKELFNQGEYNPLVKLLKSLKDFDRLTKKIDDVQIHDPSIRFGLNREPWHDDPRKLRLMTGKTCVAATFPKKYWEKFGKYDSTIPFGHEGEMQFNAAKDKKWTVYFNNAPLIHMRSSDTHRLNNNEKVYFSNMMNNTHPKFEKKYGWKLDHFELNNFSEVRIIHYKEITNAINKMDFDSIDYIFDELFQRLKHKVLSNCEHQWCPSRKVCTYK